MAQQFVDADVKKNNNGALLIGTGLVVASMILVPALAVRMGLGASLTGALRIALMKASSRAVASSMDDSKTA
jgi:hypothetical protein